MYPSIAPTGHEGDANTFSSNTNRRARTKMQRATEEGQRKADVAISGFPGSGKSTIGRRLAKLLRYQYVSAGSFMREFANERKTSIDEIGSVAETGREFDEFIDDRIRSLAGHPEVNHVFDSRMAWHFVPKSLRIHLEVSLPEAAIRAISRPGSSEEAYGTVPDAKRALSARRMSEVKRYREYYGVDIEDLTNYDIVIFTDNLSANDVYRTIISQSLESRPPSLEIFASPLSLIPTQSIRHLKEKEIRSDGFDLSNPIEVIAKNGNLFIADGHNRTAAAVLRGLSTIRMTLRGQGSKWGDLGALTDGVKLKTMIYDWEDALGIKLPEIQSP